MTSPSPWQMTWPEWRDVLKSTFKEAGDDNVGLVAAGVAFYAFLALVPLLGALVLSYGLVATPRTVVENLRSLTQVMPAEAAKLIGEQLLSVVQASSGKKGFGLLLALGIALFGARNGAGALITALNIAYEEKEERGFVALNLLALGMTVAAVVAAIVAVIAIAALSHLGTLFAGAPAVLLGLGKLLSYVAVVLLGAAGAASLYRYGPSRPDAKWTWLTPGSLFAAIGWGLLTLGFSLYVANFGNYDATYGSLGAVVVLLTWIWLTAYVLLLGAELNSEIERTAPVPTTDEPGIPAVKQDMASNERPARAEISHLPAPAADNGASRRSGAPKVVSFATQRAAIRAGKATGGRKLGLAAPAIASLGLSWLGRRGKERQGLVALAAAAGFVWLRRRD